MDGNCVGINITDGLPGGVLSGTYWIRFLEKKNMKTSVFNRRSKNGYFGLITVTTEYEPSSLDREIAKNGSFEKNMFNLGKCFAWNWISAVCRQCATSSVTMIISPQSLFGIPVNLPMYWRLENDTKSLTVVSKKPKNSELCTSFSITSNFSFCMDSYKKFHSSN